MFINKNNNISLIEDGSYLLFDYARNKRFPNITSNINELSFNVSAILDEYMYSDIYITVQFDPRQSTIPIDNRQIQGFMVCLYPVYRDGIDSIEIIKMYGGYDTRVSLLTYFTKKIQKTTHMYIYTSTPAFALKLMEIGMGSNATLVDSTLSGIHFFKPKFRLTSGPPRTLSILPMIVNIMDKYMGSTVYYFKLYFGKETLKLLQAQVITPSTDISGKEIESFGRFKLHYNTNARNLFMEVFKPREREGSGTKVGVMEAELSYHTHPREDDSMGKDYRFLMAWPSGTDYAYYFIKRFRYNEKGCYVNIVLSIDAIYSVSVSYMCVYFIREYVLPHPEVTNIIDLIAVVIKYYFKLVENLRTIHKHIYGKHTRHILPHMRRNMGDLHVWLCRSFTCDKLLDILGTNNKKLKNLLIRNSSIRDETVYDRTVDTLRTILIPFSFTFFRTDIVTWEHLDWTHEVPLWVQMCVSEEEVSELKKGRLFPPGFPVETCRSDPIKVVEDIYRNTI